MCLELRILLQVCIQRPLMESARGHRVAGDLPVQGTIAHEVNGGFKDKEPHSTPDGRGGGKAVFLSLPVTSPLKPGPLRS